MTEQPDTPHVPLDLSYPWNEGSPPQCWKCGLPWPSEGTCTGVPNADQLATMLDDPDTWAQGLATEVRRLTKSDRSEVVHSPEPIGNDPSHRGSDA